MLVKRKNKNQNMSWGIDEISSTYWTRLKLMDLASLGFLWHQIANEGIRIESKLQSGSPKMLLAAISWKATSRTQMVGRCVVWCHWPWHLKRKIICKAFIQTNQQLLGYHLSFPRYLCPIWAKQVHHGPCEGVEKGVTWDRTKQGNLSNNSY